MRKSLKHTRNMRDSMRSLKQRYESFEKDLIGLVGQDAYQQTIKHYDDVIAKLTDEMQILPTGYRYTGTFYLKVPYVVPTGWEKIEGSAFMREDLISWEIENQDDTKKYYGYCRAIFKKPEFNTEISKEEAVPVYLNTPKPA